MDMDMDMLERIAETYAWYQAYGNQVDEQPLATYVSNVERPEIWVANHVSRVRANSRADIERVLAQADKTLAHCTHRMVIIDPQTPEAFVARLALDDYHELTPTLQMVLEGALVGPTASFEIRPVVSDADWDALYVLVRADQVEGKRTHHMLLSEEITRAMVDGYRAKRAVQQFFLAEDEGVPCAYGAAVVGPWSLGIVEDLFTAQSHRKRGIATALIAHAVSHARERGMGPMLIGAHVTEAAKKLYATLGFTPHCVTRQYLFDREGLPQRLDV